jgi:hypothetical protein
LETTGSLSCTQLHLGIPPACLVQFTPDSQRLVACTYTFDVYVIDLTAGNEGKILAVFGQHGGQKASSSRMFFLLVLFFFFPREKSILIVYFVVFFL